MLLTTVDTEAPLYDSTAVWHGRTMDGVFHTGNLVEDPRFADRTLC